jgi:hypothetical protein
MLHHARQADPRSGAKRMRREPGYDLARAKSTSARLLLTRFPLSAMADEFEALAAERARREDSEKTD